MLFSDKMGAALHDMRTHGELRLVKKGGRHWRRPNADADAPTHLQVTIDSLIRRDLVKLKRPGVVAAKARLRKAGRRPKVRPSES